MNSRNLSEIPEEMWPMPETVAHLHALKRGQTLSYYRGDFEADIERSVAARNDTLHRKQGVNRYRFNLELIRDVAEALEKAGDVALSTHRVRDGEMVYIARGLTT